MALSFIFPPLLLLLVVIAAACISIFIVENETTMQIPEAVIGAIWLLSLLHCYWGVGIRPTQKQEQERGEKEGEKVKEEEENLRLL